MDLNFSTYSLQADTLCLVCNKKLYYGRNWGGPMFKTFKCQCSTRYSFNMLNNKILLYIHLPIKNYRLSINKSGCMYLSNYLDDNFFCQFTDEHKEFCDNLILKILSITKDSFNFHKLNDPKMIDELYKQINTYLLFQ